MKGRPEQSFLDTFSERFMNHVRQVNIITFISYFFIETLNLYIVISHSRCALSQNQFPALNVFTTMTKSAYLSLASSRCFL